MPASRPFVRATLVAAASLVATATFAQRIPAGTTVPSASVSAFHQFETGLDSGGDFSVTGALASADLVHQFTPEFGAGISLRYAYEDWRFAGTSAAFGGAPWGNVQRPSVGVALTYSPSDEWLLLALPTLQWAFENGASTGDAAMGGAVFAATRRISPDLSLGIGAGVFDELGETQAFPFLIVDWRFADRWRLSNPFRAGPAGGAGIEVAYALNDAWEIAASGTWRKYRFRLDRDGPYADGIGESRGIPLFLRASHTLARDARLDVYAGAIVGGKLAVMDPDGNDIASDDYGAAPILGVTLRTRF